MNYGYITLELWPESLFWEVGLGQQSRREESQRPDLAEPDCAESSDGIDDLSDDVAAKQGILKSALSNPPL